jgi:hypothetical protein
MNPVDRTIKALPFARAMLADTSMQEINTKWDIFDAPNITKEKQLQRLSTVNQYDHQMEHATNGGRIPNMYYHQLMSAISSENKKRRIVDFRTMSQYPFVENAIREICNEVFEKDDIGEIFKCRLRGNYNDEVKSLIEKEFQKFVNVFRFEEKGWQYVKDWIIEGELFFENLVSAKKPELGIIGTRRVAAERIDPLYYDLDNELIDCFILRPKEYDDYPYQWGKYTAQSTISQNRLTQPLFLNDKQVSYIVNDMWETTGKKFRNPILALAHGPYRQLSLIEDATVIYMLVRAPERLVFNVDVGNLPAAKSEQYVKRLMSSFWSKKTINQSGGVENVYDPQGMIDNYWFPKTRDGAGTTVESVGGGKQSADNLDTLNYFVQKLYTALHVPVGRLNSETAFSDGEAITREELRFAEFIIQIQKIWTAGVKRSFITHLKLRGRKIVELADKHEVNHVDVPSKTNPQSQMRVPLATIKDNIQVYLDDIGWEAYEILSETLDKVQTEKIQQYIQEKNQLLEEIEKYDSLITSFENKLVTESRKKVKSKISEQIETLISEKDSAAKTFEYLDGKIKEVEDEGDSWWNQYDLTEDGIDIKMNEPCQFHQIREQQLLQQKLDNYTNIAANDFISATFAQKLYFGWTDDQIIQNRTLMQRDAAFRWELAQIEASGPDFREKALEEMEGMTGELGGGMGGMGGGSPLPGGEGGAPAFGAPPEGEGPGLPGGEGGEAPEGEEAAPEPPAE